MHVVAQVFERGTVGCAWINRADTGAGIVGIRAVSCVNATRAGVTAGDVDGG